MCHAPLLVRGSNKVQQDSPVRMGKARPALPEGQVLLNPARQSVSAGSRFGWPVRSKVLMCTSGSSLRSRDETATHARLLRVC